MQVEARSIDVPTRSKAELDDECPGQDDGSRYSRQSSKQKLDGDRRLELDDEKARPPKVRARSRYDGMCMEAELDDEKA